MTDPDKSSRQLSNPLSGFANTLRAFIKDLRNQGATDPQTKSDNLSKLRFIVSLPVSMLASSVSFVNSLTPTFAGLIDFRIRQVILLTTILFLFVLSIRIITAKMTVPGGVVGSQVQRYRSARPQRKLAKLALLPLLIAAIILSVDFRYWSSQTGTVEGLVTNALGEPQADVEVNLLNLDHEAVSERARLTDRYGRFFLELTRGKGRGAYFSMSSATGGCLRYEKAKLVWISNKATSDDSPDAENLYHASLRYSCLGN